MTCGSRASPRSWATTRRGRTRAAAGGRRRLLAGGSLAEAARCTLDLVTQRVAAGRLDALGGLGHDLLAAFGHRGAAILPAMTIDWLAGMAAEEPRRYAVVRIATHHQFLRLRAQGDRPDLIPGVRDLADRLLVAVRQGAGA